MKLVTFFMGGRLFVAHRNGIIKGIEADTGKIAWSTDTDLTISGDPGGGDGLVVFGANRTSAPPRGRR